MAEAYIVSTKRTVGGRRGGALAEWHPVDLAAQTLNAVILKEPLFATDRVLQRARMKTEDIDLYDVNKAFAPVPIVLSFSTQ